MKPARLVFILSAALMIALSSPLAAQDDSGACPALVERALTVAGEACQGLGRNQVCYGHTLVDATDFDGAPLPDFESSGDQADVTALASLITAPLDVVGGTWGVALLSLQANLPDTLPGQNVTFVVFGDVQLRSGSLLTLAAQASGSINVRGGPGTAFAVIGGLSAGQPVLVTGRNAAGDWLQVKLAEGFGWVLADLLAVEGDMSLLPILDAEEEPAPVPGEGAPMQAFTLRAGLGAPQCEEAPPDGVLVQAPQETTVAFLVNGIEVEIGSTALFRMDTGGVVRISTLDGTVSVASAGVTQAVEPGFGVPALAGAPPPDPAPYNYAQIRAVPVQLLPEPVPVPLPVPSTLPAAEWADSGVAVTAGQTFTLRAQGEIDLWPDCYEPNERGFSCRAMVFSPEGSEEIGPAGSEYQLPGALVGALIGRIGEDGDPFLVGEGGTFTADAEGTLQFRINDVVYLEDNAGVFVVLIDLE